MARGGVPNNLVGERVQLNTGFFRDKWVSGVIRATYQKGGDLYASVARDDTGQLVEVVVRNLRLKGQGQP